MYAVTRGTATKYVVQRELEYEKQREAEKQRAKRVKNIAHRKLLEMQVRVGLALDVLRAHTHSAPAEASGTMVTTRWWIPLGSRVRCGSP